MAWDFETEPDFQAKLDWVDGFVRDDIEPLDHLIESPYDVSHPAFKRLVRPLQARVRAERLWACHLGPEMGGQGYGQVKLALMNELLGRSRFGPVVFGCQAPDSGNAEILAHYGNDEQKRRWLRPLLDNEIVSCFSMTEPLGGADPLMFTTAARLENGRWIIDGEKWFSSNARYADFLIVMVVTEPDAPSHERMSMLIVPANAPGVEIVRNVGTGAEQGKSHAYIRYKAVSVPADHLLGGRGEAFKVAQTRLGGGRIHHAMRTIGLARAGLDMMCERVVSRFTKNERLSEKQMVQEKIADSWIELEQFRLLVLRTAWRIDKYQDYKMVRRDISAIKAAMPKLLHDIAGRALHLHGALGVSDEMPFLDMIADSYAMGLADGPTEVHKAVVARQTLAGFPPSTALFPDYHLPAVRRRAQERYAEEIAALPDAGWI